MTNNYLAVFLLSIFFILVSARAEADQVNFSHITYVESTQHTDIIKTLKKMRCKEAHFTNGTYAYEAKLIVPTVLAGFKYIIDSNGLKPLVIAVNSDESMRSLNISTQENQRVRADKVAVPLSKLYPEALIAVIFYDEKTPTALYEALSKEGMTFTLHKWGYGTHPQAPKIEGAEFFKKVYAFPLLNDIKPVCHHKTPVSKESQQIEVVDLEY